MKAIVYTKYGLPTVFELVELERPQPKDDEVLIQNNGSSINTVDIVARSGKSPKAKKLHFWLNQFWGEAPPAKSSPHSGRKSGEYIQYNL